MKKRTARLVVVFVALALVASACGGDDDAGTDLEPVTFGLASKNAGHAVLWVAIEEGFFADEGIEFIPLLTETDSRLFIAIAAGAIDMSLGTTAGVWEANKAGADLVHIGGVQNISYYRMVADPEITDVSQLAGMKFGVSEVQIGIDAFIAKIWLEELGIDTSAIEFVNSGGQSSRVAALIGGAVDVVLASAPSFVPVLDEGFSDLGASVDTISHIQQTTVIVRKSTLEDDKERDKIVSFMSAYAKAADFTQNPANEAAVIAALVTQLRASEEDAKLFYDLYVPSGVVTPDGGVDELGVKVWADFVGTDSDSLFDQVDTSVLEDARKS